MTKLRASQNVGTCWVAGFNEKSLCLNLEGLSQ